MICVAGLDSGATDRAGTGSNLLVHRQFNCSIAAHVPTCQRTAARPVPVFWTGLDLVVYGDRIGVGRRRAAAFAEFPPGTGRGRICVFRPLHVQGIPPYQLAYNMKFPGTYAAYAVIMGFARPDVRPDSSRHPLWCALHDDIYRADAFLAGQTNA